MLSLIIPTKNRPADLKNAIASIVEQSIFPDELIIVDQSHDLSSKMMVENILDGIKNINLIYIYDVEISGLIEAKKVGVDNSCGDIICFIEDDVVLSSDYIEQITSGFSVNKSMLGCCGIMTNFNANSKFYLFVFELFHRGIFKDVRQRVTLGKVAKTFVLSDKLSGGISAWRREVFYYLYFDVKNSFHMLEDIEFSTRVYRYFNGRLFINQKVRLAHYSSPIQRDGIFLQKRRKSKECIIYFKKRIGWEWSISSMLWLMMGMFFESIFISLSIKSFSPLKGFLLGIRDGILHKISLDSVS